MEYYYICYETPDNETECQIANSWHNVKQTVKNLTHRDGIDQKDIHVFNLKDAMEIHIT